MEPFDHDPGSREAIAHGCTCSPTLNRHGHGTLHGQPRFYVNRTCPVHGDAAQRAQSADEGMAENTAPDFN